MEKMKALYEKVAGDSALQARFAGIMKDAEKAGAKVTGEKLTDFAKEAGFDISMEEVQEYFKGLYENKEKALSDAELDIVAGGKSAEGIITIVGSVLTVGALCALGSLWSEGLMGGCEKFFE